MFSSAKQGSQGNQKHREKREQREKDFCIWRSKNKCASSIFRSSRTMMMKALRHKWWGRAERAARTGGWRTARPSFSQVFIVKSIPASQSWVHLAGNLIKHLVHSADAACTHQGHGEIKATHTKLLKKFTFVFKWFNQQILISGYRSLRKPEINSRILHSSLYFLSLLWKDRVNEGEGQIHNILSPSTYLS